VHVAGRSHFPPRVGLAQGSRRGHPSDIDLRGADYVARVILAALFEEMPSTGSEEWAMSKVSRLDRPRTGPVSPRPSRPDTWARLNPPRMREHHAGPYLARAQHARRLGAPLGPQSVVQVAGKAHVVYELSTYLDGPQL